MVKDESQIDILRQEIAKININQKGKYYKIIDKINIEIGTFLD